MVNILALDLATNTGWALLQIKPDASYRVTSGVINFKNNRFHGGGMRFLRFRHWLDEMQNIFSYDIAAVYFEEVRRHLGVDAAHVYGGFLATLTSWCEENCIAYQGVSVGTIKQHATGKGNASKQKVIDSMISKGYTPTDDNEADALALAEWVRSHQNLQQPK